MRRTLVLAIVLGLVPLTARAEEAPRRWYGWEIMLADAGALVVLIAGSAADSELGAGLGAAVFVLGGPVIHGVHGNGGKAVLSGGLRLGLPLTLGAIANATCDEDEHEFLGCLGPVGGAVLGGAAVAMIVDYVLLAYAREPPAVNIAVLPRPDGGLTFGLAGTF